MNGLDLYRIIAAAIIADAARTAANTFGLKEFSFKYSQFDEPPSANMEDRISNVRFWPRLCKNAR